MKKILLSPEANDGGTPTAATPNVGQQIGDTIKSVGDVVAPIVTSFDPPIGKAIKLAFTLLAVMEPAAYNAVAALLSKQPLTPEQEQAIADVESALENPDSYLEA